MVGVGVWPQPDGTEVRYMTNVGGHNSWELDVTSAPDVQRNKPARPWCSHDRTGSKNSQHLRLFSPITLVKRFHSELLCFRCSKKRCRHAVPNERISANAGMARTFAKRGSISICG
jgi:hypothetical protein